MIPIYICEDNPVYLEFIVKEVNKLLLINDYDMKISHATADPEKLLAIIPDESANGIYFLDVDLTDENYNGFKLAQAIRKIDNRGYIIFITTHGELSFETFKYRVEALDYIVKDNDDVALRIAECLENIQKRVSSRSNESGNYLSIKVISDVHNIPLKDIIMIETSMQKHRLILSTVNQQLEFFGSLNEIVLKLDDNFMRVHRSFIINKNKIVVYNNKDNTLNLVGDNTCLVSRSMKNKVKDLLNI